MLIFPHCVIAFYRTFPKCVAWNCKWHFLNIHILQNWFHVKSVWMKNVEFSTLCVQDLQFDVFNSPLLISRNFCNALQRLNNSPYDLRLHSSIILWILARHPNFCPTWQHLWRKWDLHEGPRLWLIFRKYFQDWTLNWFPFEIFLCFRL